MWGSAQGPQSSGAKYCGSNRQVNKIMKAVPALWDIQTNKYRDRNLMFDETVKIASHFKTNVDEISRKTNP